MTYSDKKMAVLSLLRKEGEALSLPEIMSKLGSDFSERTVRRWLAEFVSEDIVEKTGIKRGTRYRAADGKVVDNLSEKSREAIQYVRQPLFDRKPVAYSEAWFESYEPNRTFYLDQRTRDQLYKTGQRATEEEPAGTYARHIYNRLLIDLSYNSSRLEGNTYSLIDTERLLIEGESAEGKLDQEKIMILNHKEAIRYLVDHADRLEVDDDVVCTLHYLLSDGLVLSKDAGKVREEGVRIGSSTYIPFDNPAKLKKQLKLICKKAKQITDPFEQSIFLLVHLSYLQSFIDVNKRTARLSANIPLIKKNLVPLSFNDMRKDDYASALVAIYELNEVSPLVELFTLSYLRTCQMYNATIEAIGFDRIRVRYRQQRRDIIRHIIASELTGRPMEDYIDSKTEKWVKGEDQLEFLRTVQEDLAEISIPRIAGLGLTVEQLNRWLKIH